VGLKVKTQDWVVSTEATKTDSGPTFFVLTPTYNRAERLLSAIESVRNQSYADCHHFILDDGSSDETPQILDRFRADPQIDTWRFDVNRGVNEARNFLLERILEQEKAGFIVILDDDDRLEKDCLSRFAEAARAFPSGRWFIGNCLYPNGRAITQIRGGSEALCYVRDHKLGKRLSGDVAHVFHTSIIGDIRFSDDFPNAEEWWFYSALARHSMMYPIDFHAKTQEYLEGGLTLSQPNKGQDAKVYALKLKRFDRFLSQGQRASLEARLGRHLFAQGNRREGLRQIGRAFCHWPLEPRVYLYVLEILLRPIWRKFRSVASVAES
jgi:glycosyltransferase involved in cell wall biosynthesis